MKIHRLIVVLLLSCLHSIAFSQSSSYDVLQLFTDKTCSELRPDITEEEIAQCSDSYYRNLAEKMYKGEYKCEFRVDTFRAYPHPRLMAERNGTMRYSLLDNPTGIVVDAGERLIVFVGDMHGKTLKLKVRDIENAPAGEISGEEYTLKEGTNRITISESGLVYVLYHTSVLNDSTALPVKMHFANAKVNGYFDSERHAGRWTELLKKAEYKFFDVLGKYAHITAETTLFRKHTGDRGEELISIYDRLVESEQELLGLKKYDRMMTNRLYMQETWGFGALYATQYMTGYPAASMGSMLDPDVILGDRALWGPAHEVGHVNQTRPALYWVGLTEVTNNIMSQYVTKTIFGGHSRLQYTQLLPVYQNYYSKGWTEIIAKKASFCDFKGYNDDNDVMVRLVPFWQLQLYYGEVLGRTPEKQEDHGGFYPEVYEYARNKDYTGYSHAQLMLNFVYNACIAAHANLYSFFEKWGFARVVDAFVGDYTSAQVTVTESMLESLRKRVNNLGYPEPEVALEYISDNTVELYRTLPDIIKGEPAEIRRTAYYDGKATQENDEIRIRGWKNVVAFEVRDAQDSLICANSGEVTPSEDKMFQLLSFWKKGYRLFAVSARGERMEVEVPYEGMEDNVEEIDQEMIYEDFSLFPTDVSGSIEDGWCNIDSKYTHQPEWKGAHVYSDNQTCRLSASSSSYLQTPPIDISVNADGRFTLSLKHKYAADDYLYVTIYPVDEEGNVDTSTRLKRESIGGSKKWEDVTRQYAFDAEKCPTRRVVVRLQSYWYQTAYFDDIKVIVPQVPTIIADVYHEPTQGNDAVYDLQGRKTVVSPHSKSIVIRNRKKYFSK